MADLTRAEELVRAMGRDAGFLAEVQQAPTVAAKRQAMDAHGFGDISLEDMRTYVESKGGTLNAPPSGRELSEQELAAVAGGATGLVDDIANSLVFNQGMSSSDATAAASAAVV